jgi:two-component system nitrogen regulation response regulator NtrX
MPLHRNAPLILIVDDDPLIRLDLSSTLEEAGYRTAEAASAREALARLREQRPDLIITDLYMEQPAEGIGLIRGVRSSDPDVKIVAMSGHTQRRYEALDRAEQSGAHGALGKPIHRVELLDLVTRLVPPDA